ncbi:sugar phosphate isomerase/epimerase family protein [Microvirga zambiensis]|uniref:sugar phosphate isomerase/epimerase family protein n=1 Tax=Microvirga zambiensis TaxID=1402137 RepID=UPI00191DC3EF|nr:sugar phosphate isomerase/epimerase family protein [Microvirga zambiensis]
MSQTVTRTIAPTAPTEPPAEFAAPHSMIPFKIALHTWTIEDASLEEAIDAAMYAGFDAVELRRSDFSKLIEKDWDDSQIVDFVLSTGIPVSTLGVEYGWLYAEGDEKSRLFEVFRQSCKNAVALGCPVLMSAPGHLSGTMDKAIESLREAGDIAGEHGLRLGIEFNSQHKVLNNLEEALELIDRANRRSCGLLLDAYHLHRSGRSGRGFEVVPGDLIYAFQFSDCPPDPMVGLRRPTDRLPPGKGVVDWDSVLGLLFEKGYRGTISYEAPNDKQWLRPAKDVAEEAMIATRMVLDKALGVKALVD